MEWPGEKGYGPERGDGGAEGCSKTGDGGQAAVSPLMLMEGTFASLKVYNLKARM